MRFVHIQKSIPWHDNFKNINMTFICFKGDWAVYIILNLCRVLAYIKEGLVLSKQQGGLWGIEKLPGEYSDLIKRAAQCCSSDSEFEYDTGMLKQFAGYMLGEIFHK